MTECVTVACSIKYLEFLKKASSKYSVKVLCHQKEIKLILINESLFFSLGGKQKVDECLCSWALALFVA